MEVKLKDIAWLAGLLEGEGCFRLKVERDPQISLGMTDEDIVIRVASMWNTGIYRYKNMYYTHIQGARAVAWMMTLCTLLGKRRREKVIKIIKFWKEYSYSRAPRGMRTMATCHPDRVVVAFGLCDLCYAKRYRRRKKEQRKLLTEVVA